MVHLYPVQQLSAVLLTILVTAGCRPSRAVRRAFRDRGDPLMERAAAWEQSGDTEEAVELYRRIVLQHPLNAEAHFNLALLLHDLRLDYVEAIYHYRVFTRLRPDSDKTPIARDRMRNAERLLRVQLAERVPDEGVAGIDAHTATQLRVLQQKLAASEAANRTLRDQVDAAEAKVLEMEAATRDMQRRIDSLERQLAAALRPPESGAPDSAAYRDLLGPALRPETVRTYEVRPGDSLMRIAEQVYGDAARWTEIRDANPEKVDGQNRLHTGQILTIP